jgi:hypothetical protein
MVKLRTNLLIAVAVLCLASCAVASAKPSSAQKPAKACVSCHRDFSSVLPKGHPEVKKTGLDACVSCHALGQAEDAKKNAFSTRIHLTHTNPQLKLQCTACHTYVPGKKFGLIGQSTSLGAPKKDDMAAIKEKFASWQNSSHTDHLHAKAMVDCAGCHGKETPLLDATVENARCLACHGPLEKLASKTEPKDLPKRNPHNSHLGEISCTVCHHAHSASTVYCLDCHKTFKMTVPGAGQ